MPKTLLSQLQRQRQLLLLHRLCFQLACNQHAPALAPAPAPAPARATLATSGAAITKYARCLGRK